MRRRVKDGLREARLKVRASRADVASDLAYRLVPARIDVDVGTDCEDARDALTLRRASRRLSFTRLRMTFALGLPTRRRVTCD